VRVILCAAFITLAVRGVAIHDRVSILASEAPDSEIEQVRLIGEQADEIIVLASDGVERTVPRSRIAKDAGGRDMIERGLITAFRHTDKTYVVLALLIFAPVTPLQGWRLWLMLKAQDIRIPLWECIKISFCGNFLNYVFMIGSTSGDVFKAYRVASHTPTHKTEAVTTILLDRAAGLVGLLLVMSVSGLLLSGNPIVRRIGWVAVLACVGLLVGLVVASSNWFSRLLPERFLSRLPASGQLKRVYQAIHRLGQHKMIVLGALAMAVVLQWFAVGGFVTCARALQMDFSDGKVWDYFAYIATGHVVAAIPITAQGLGTMELTYKTLFLGTHGTLSQLLCLAIWVRLLQLAWSLPGAAVMFVGGWRKKADAAIPQPDTSPDVLP